ncbi:hypothetical protein HHJ78_10840 [Mobiluncus mulieris]|uniref:Uncharacterized protein n=1 Tax=Mobiluncus mulieris TaxID=2052 RepID=A0A7Y0U2V6_9ACTO|nr:hypothetical protein [Mobiluncus mulieris]NMW65980.1 hypothetical protein [Mobiluncus mulieris]
MTWLALVTTIAADISTITGSVLAGFTRPTSASEIALLVIATSLTQSKALEFLAPFPPENTNSSTDERVNDTERLKAQQQLESTFIFQ